jgi:hypothetical protein
MIIGYDLKDFETLGLKIPLHITLPKTTSNILIAGKSGSGKSQSVRWYVWNMLNTNESTIYIADYKGGEEYETFEGTPSYASGENAIDMIEKFYELFTLVRSKRIHLKKHYTLVIEEWFGLLVYAETKSKKLKSDLMSKIGELLAVSRGLNMGVIICVQRADASLFSTGAREQFQCVCCFGRTSSEQFRMLGYSGELEENPTQNYKAGQAIVLIDGQEGVQEIIVPFIKNPDMLCKAICSKLALQSSISSIVRAIASGESPGN